MSEDLTQERWLDWSIELAEHAMHIAPEGADKIQAVSALINAAMIHLNLLEGEGVLAKSGLKTVKELQGVMLKQFKALSHLEIEVTHHNVQ